MQLTKDDIEGIVAAGVKQAFNDIGIEADEPFETRKDFAHLREWRLTCEQIRGRGMITTMTLILTGLAALLILGFRGWLFQ